MYNFILKRQPKSYQGSSTYKSKQSKENYVNDLEDALKKYYPTVVPSENEELYGLVYYFFKKDVGTDADNISKPIWDCLKGKLITDDKQIKLRTAGVFNLSAKPISLINVSGLKGDILLDLLDAFDKEEHIVYIECGVLDYSLYKFNLQNYGN